MTEPTHSQPERERANRPQPGAAPVAEGPAALGEAAPALVAGAGVVDPRLRAGGAAQRARLLRQIQRVQGNGHAERLLSGAAQVAAPESRGTPTRAETIPVADATAQEIAAQPLEHAPFESVAAQRTGEPEAVQRSAGAPVQRLFEGGILRAVAGFARNLPGYSMLGLLIGRDPITGEEVERTPKNVLRAVMGLVPMGDTLFQQLDEAGAIDRVFGWVEGQIAQLGLSWGAIKGLFKQAWDALSATDLLSPGKAWDKLKAIFTAPIARLRSFAAGIGQQVMQFIFEVVMEKLGGGPVVSLLQKAGGAFGAIVKDPIAFVGNLIGGVRLGFTNFVANILTHLKSGLMGWLFGEVAKSGISLPARFDMKGILELVLQVVGLTWNFIRGQAAKVLGEPVVAKLETGFALFKAVKEQGIGGLWEQLKEQLGGLKDSLMEGAKDLVITQVIQAGVQWLLGLLAGPAGAIVKAIQTTYSIVMWIVNNGGRLMALMNSVVDSLGAIAAGSLGQAAGLIERSLGQAVPVVIGFLANLLGLGGLGQKIRGVIEKLQAPVRKAIGWVLGKAKGYAKKFLAKVKGAFGGKPETEAQKQERLRKGLDAGVKAVEKLKGKPLSGPILNLALTGVRKFYKLSLLEPFVKDKRWAVRGDIQRTMEMVTEAPATTGYRPIGEELRVLVHNAAQRVLEHPEVRREAARMQNANTHSITISGPAGFPAAVDRMRRTPPGSHQYEIGYGRTQASEQPGAPFMRMGNIHNRLVNDVGSYSNTPGKKSNELLVAEEMADISNKTQLTDAQIASGVREFVATGRLGRGLRQHRDKISAIALLMFGRESARNVGNIAFAAMTTELIAAPNDPMTFQQATNDPNAPWFPKRRDPATGRTQGGFGAGGDFPMSMKGAQTAAAELERERHRDEPSGERSPRAQELARRETALAERWLANKIPPDRTFRDRADAENFIYQKLLQFYRIKTRPEI